MSDFKFDITPAVEAAIEAPQDSFAMPADVVNDASLTLTEKLSILRRWEQAEIDLERAADEGMKGAQRSRLDEINNALMQLDPTHDATEQSDDILSTSLARARPRR